MRRAALGVALAALISPWIARADEASQVPLKITWNAPATCPTAEDVADRVRHLLSKQAPLGATVTAAARIRRVGDDRLELVLTTEVADARGTRTVRAGSCAALAEAAAVFIALAIDSTRDTRPPAEPSPSSVRDVEPEVPVPASPKPPRSPESSSRPVVQPVAAEHRASRDRVRPGTGAYGVFDVGALPDASAGLALNLHLRVARIRAGLLGSVWHAQQPTFDEERGAGASFQMHTAGLFGCYVMPIIYQGSTTQSCYAAFVVNTSTLPADLELEYDGETLDISKSVYRTKSGTATLTQHRGPIAPGEGVVLFVSDGPSKAGASYVLPCPPGIEPALYYESTPRGTQLGSSFHLKASVPVSAASIFPFGGARSLFTSATLLLPVPRWAKENVLINAWSTGLGPGANQPGVQIVASEDDTDVTIVPKRDIQDGLGVVGARAGTPATYHLEKGQFLQFVQREELTGSFVTSTKPTSIFGGHACMTIPAHRGPCDTANQQIPAYEQWGSEYVGVGYRPRVGDEHEVMPYRIMAVRDGTRLDYDPEVPVGAPLELRAGEVVAFTAGVGDAFVVRTQDAEHPIYLAAHMTSYTSDYLGNFRMYNVGDPEFVNVVAAGQYLTSASFYADPTYADTSLVIVRAKTGGEFKDVVLDCLGGPVPGFRPVGTRGEYEFTRITFSDRARPGVKSDGKLCYYGAHHLRSEGTFTATLWGMDVAVSYAYPSGMATRKLVTAPLLTK